MRVLLINEVCGYTSTGKIAAEIAEDYSAKGNEVKIAYGRNSYVPDEYQKYAVRIGGYLDVAFHVLCTRAADRHGFGSVRATNRFLDWAEKYNPSLLWLHNLHGYYINAEILFSWIKKHPEMTVKWTLHDCWAFTGHCAYFSAIGCSRWVHGCHDCPQKRKYPAAFGRDNSMENYIRKKAAFLGVKNLELITPSEWLKDHVQRSFLSCYPVTVQYHMVDQTVFKPKRSGFRRKYGIGNRKIVLGVANVWDARKGYKDFMKLAKMLDDQFVIVMTGLDKRRIRNLPGNIIGIGNIKDAGELAGIYSSADYFFNPSREETFGLTTAEAIACGTYAIVYKDTACEEVVTRLYPGKGAAVRQGSLKEVCDILYNKSCPGSLAGSGGRNKTGCVNEMIG